MSNLSKYFKDEKIEKICKDLEKLPFRIVDLSYEKALSLKNELKMLSTELMSSQQSLKR